MRQLRFLERFLCTSVFDQKVLKVAVLGAPNAGKSTLINAAVGSRVSAVSEIKHTTRTVANGIKNIGNCQIIFTDTPGIVSYEEGHRLNMDRAHLRGPRRVAGSVDMLAIITDVASKKTRNFVDENIIEIMNSNLEVPAILILNKIDLLKRKEDLIPVASMLMQKRTKDVWGYHSYGGSERFQKCFMISAFSGDGVDDLLNYFVSSSKLGTWEYSDQIYCDSSIDFQISEVFREKLLIMFGHEIPWKVKQETVLFHGNDDVVRLHQKLTWPKKSQCRYVMTKLDQLSHACETELSKMFHSKVILTVDISQKHNMTKDDLKYY
ncbi:GTPase Era, mitochondrial-like [Hydra vulgaris]|uniref:GTPase Era, mitochondrial n=1 Tax=Hydra vulgaris TaxID=6087 RepID=A0ABM4DPF2_HYDVU